MLVDIDIQRKTLVFDHLHGQCNDNYCLPLLVCRWQKYEEKLGNTQAGRVLPMYKCTNAQLCTKDARTKPIQTCHAFRACQKVGGMCESILEVTVILMIIISGSCLSPTAKLNSIHTL